MAHRLDNDTRYVGVGRVVIGKYVLLVNMGIWECNSDVDRLYNAKRSRTKSKRIENQE